VYLKLLGPDERADHPREGSMVYSFLASSLTQAARRATEGPVLWYKLMQDVGWQDLRVVPRYHQEPGEGIDVRYTISGVKP
jgi:hypothetical protein